MKHLATLVCAVLSTLCLSTVEAGGLTFLVVGDWGGQTDAPYTTEAQLAVADAMGSVGNIVGSEFVLSLGDNFYENGVTDVDDPRFKAAFEDVFTASSLQTNWYVVCGNHDHYGNCSAEIAYSKVSSRWSFPDYYYKQEFSLPGSTKTLNVVFLDTIILAGLTDPLLESMSPSGPKSVKMAEDEWTWINKTLAEYSKTDGWTIVVGHYPVWSVGKHGPTDLLVQRLKPMLEMYGVEAYLSGHDHNLQHINDTKVQYYVVGAGHLVEHSTKHEDDVPKGSLQYIYHPDDSDKKGGFASVSVTEETFTVTFFNYKGNIHYQSVITK